MLTVFLATRNGEQTLPSALYAFTSVEAPASGWKLVVVDNGSTDRTREIVTSFLASLPLTYVFEERMGKNVALNTGLAHLEGDLAVFTDDDTFPLPDWLVRLRAAADDNPSYSMFGGVVLPRWAATPPHWIHWIPSGYNPVKPLARPYPSRFVGNLSVTFALTDPELTEGPTESQNLFGLNLAIRAAVFKSGVCFDTSIGPQGNHYAMGSETELLLRLARQGQKAWHVQNAVVEHFIRESHLNKSWVLRRAIRYGRGIYRLSKATDQVAVPGWLVVPRHPYIRLFTSGVRLARTYFSRNRQDAFIARWEFNYFLGNVIEMRISRRKHRFVTIAGEGSEIRG